MAEVTYYYDVLQFGQWTHSANIFDGNLTTYGYESGDGRLVRSDETTCPGTDLGTITKVEVRVYGYGDGDDRIDLSFWGPGVDEYPLTMPGTAGWSAYADVTNDPYMSPWTWAKVANHWTEAGERLLLEYDKVGKGNIMYCAKVEIRVSYTPSAGYYHGLKVQGVGELALCDVGTHPLRFRKSGTTYGVELVDITDGNASAIRIKTGAGVKAIRKYT